jgi:rod shape-determining protein MreD
MRREVRRLPVILFLLAAFVVHCALAGDMAIRGARPDIALTSLLVCCLFVDSSTGAALGFLVGLLEASYADQFVGSIIVSRTLTGMLLGALEERVFRDNVFMAIAAAVLGTVATETLFFLFAPQPHALRWFIRTGEASLYNGALSIPIYLVARRVAFRRT